LVSLCPAADPEHHLPAGRPARPGRLPRARVQRAVAPRATHRDKTKTMRTNGAGYPPGYR